MAGTKVPPPDKQARSASRWAIAIAAVAVLYVAGNLVIGLLK